MAQVPMLQPFLPSLPKMKPFLRQIKAVGAEKNLAGRELVYTRGRGLGGSTLLNDMRYMRGSRADVEAWGDPQWTFDHLLPIYKSLENNNRESAVHGDGGPLPVRDAQRSNVDSSMNVRFFEACEAAGLNPCEDFNSGDVSGYSACQSVLQRGMRTDVFGSLLESGRHLTPNLTVHTGLRAQRLQFEGGSTRVTGVELQGKDGKSEVSAKEVILCLGAIDSPALLLRSGVGPTGTVLSLPGVGQNLIQGNVVDLVFRVKNAAGVYSKSFSVRNARYMFQQWREYREDRTGVFSSFVEGMAVVPGVVEGDVSIAMHRTPHVGHHCWQPVDGFTFRITHHYPRGRGAVVVDETGETRVRGNFFEEKADVEAMDQGIQWGGLLVSKTLRSVRYQDHTGEFVGPFCSYDPLVIHPHGGLHTQEDTALFLSTSAVHSDDIFGTCALGEVVDSRLQVKGLSGVRVADQSIVPQPTTAASAVIGSCIGTRVAELI
ncbi:choline dehydrogenase [Angomonas deanei]|nr:choline dehydrogenase [Angomonas deanei]|eukprot:EPY35291.1 choline dehydrogenase [Angomonas deanei]